MRAGHKRKEMDQSKKQLCGFSGRERGAVVALEGTPMGHAVSPALTKCFFQVRKVPNGANMYDPRLTVQAPSQPGTPRHEIQHSELYLGNGFVLIQNYAGGKEGWNAWVSSLGDHGSGTTSIAMQLPSSIDEGPSVIEATRYPPIGLVGENHDLGTSWTSIVT